MSGTDDRARWPDLERKIAVVADGPNLHILSIVALGSSTVPALCATVHVSAAEAQERIEQLVQADLVTLRKSGAVQPGRALESVMQPKGAALRITSAENAVIEIPSID